MKKFSKNKKQKKNNIFFLREVVLELDASWQARRNKLARLMWHTRQKYKIW